MSAVSSVLEAAVRTATPLLIAATGELVSERAGVLNIALEGCMIAGAYAAFAVGGGAWGYPAAAAAGLVVGIVLAAFIVWLRQDQIIVGTALTMLTLGVTGALFRLQSPTTLLRTDHAVRLPLVSRLPVVGPALFAQPAVTYVGVCLCILVAWGLRRTRSGLAVRAVGDDIEAARAAGIRVGTVRSACVVFGSVMGGIAGGALVMAQAGAFAEGMSAGRGFLAIAIVALGGWRPSGVAAGSVVFGLAMAVQFLVQTLGWHVRYELTLMIPYLVTLGALVLFSRASAPAMLGRVPE